MSGKRTVAIYELDNIKIRVCAEEYDCWPIHSVTISHGWRGGIVIRKSDMLRMIRYLFKALERIEDEEAEDQASRGIPQEQ